MQNQALIKFSKLVNYRRLMIDKNRISLIDKEYLMIKKTFFS